MDYCRVVGPLDEKQGLPTNTSPLAPCKGCSKAGQETGQAQKAPVPGICQPDPPEITPQTQSCQKCVFWRLFVENWRGRLLDRPRRPRPPGICQPGAPDPLGGVWGPSLLPNSREVNGGLQSPYTGRLYPPSPF